MNKQITFSLGRFSLTIQLRDNTKSRKEDFVIEIDHAQKQQTIDSLNIDDIRAKARAMRAIHTSEG
jgi:hypothetical protein